MIYVNQCQRFFVGVNSTKSSSQKCDILSPVLYNFVFEPLLRLPAADSSLPGFGLSTDDHTDQPSPPPVKYLAYADDTLIFPKSPSDLGTLHRHLDT
ncbi:hypothetical protein PHYBLDRAFT_147603 [Phycomyces blakesleeanus NRRL 1555(-)]|uniref:Reverse transcriptase domain-containing protein n=1 Tax=Phycomyces blakesleeanus (strain ATCC 8743b / DSM 1359 / FGSC 10004 / NBRC 33097 / NRRL 1555) TaxID=763407 RepID=A0A167M5A2_PHYB8|nr:hypothetical protein PHYBLDRAFT_147603 [Phycomyces blakesleeanus NRRL 1555(-)]OAD71844.1 hypothetical protein PHYBLDRAFT_147603 [Phycomyces blakesleeanus NRRL 1555(-)]|eukprot:XP_018289884.1 hypothetical protein PHYBLDRAFT_147603 [Phycomyces blakesleeanus NRRL 1555(-)]